MTIQKLINNAESEKANYTNGLTIFDSSYDTLISQLTILARENNGILPNEFIISDNKDLFLTFENILKIFKLINLKIDNITSDIPANIRMDGNIPRTVYANEFYKLYHVMLFS